MRRLLWCNSARSAAEVSQQRTLLLLLSTNLSSVLSACGGLYHKLHMQHFASLLKHVTKHAAVSDVMLTSLKTGDKSLHATEILLPDEEENCKDVMIITWREGLFDVRYVPYINTNG